MSSDDVKALLTDFFAGDTVEVEGEGAKYVVSICSDRFQGLMPVKRQQLVYACLNEKIKTGEIHAVTMQLSTKS